jgi:O-antigen biosynthesis protein
MDNLKRLLIIGKVWPEPSSSAAGSRMMELIELFQSHGYDITFCTSASDSEYAADLTLSDVRVKKIKLNHASFNKFVKELNPTVVLFDRFMTEEQYGWRVSSECPNAVRILDTEDLHCLRLARAKAWKQNREFSLDNLNNEEVAFREIASIYRCDLSLIISEAELTVLTQKFGIDHSLLCYMPFLLDQIDENFPSYDDREDFISIGNFLHEPNWNAVQWLKREIWPLIRRELPGSRLHLYGAYPTKKVFELHNHDEGFLVHGRAESAEEVLKEARVLLAPLRFGAGLKGKLIDAMRCGTPNVTSTIGAEGIADGDDWSGYITDQPDNFAKLSARLYRDRKIWNQSQKAGYEIIKRRFRKSDYAPPFMDQLERIEQNLVEHRSNNFTGNMLMHHTMQSSKYLSKWIEEKNR